MQELLKRLNALADWLDEENPDEPAYDPVQFGGMLVVCMAAAGALYWLLWTLLVFEGGLQSKLGCLLQLLRGKPYNPDDFEGWLGNAGALVLSLLALAGLRRLYAQAALKAAKK